MSTPEVVEAILAHHGVKGMKWGVRRDRPSAVTVTTKGKKLKTKGGYGHEPHSDAVRARTSGQIAKKSGVKALSNADLEAYNRRLNLEQNTKRLMYEDSPALAKFVKTILRQTGKTQAQDAANQVASHQVKKALKKAALVAA